jgi:HlyD family secretion protein
VRIVVWQEPSVVQVPVGSLFRNGEAWAVFVVENGRAAVRPVEIGRRNGTMAQVLGGLAGGDRVVVHPPDTLRDGARVVAS